jgi:hypothetical protein
MPGMVAPQRNQSGRTTGFKTDANVVLGGIAGRQTLGAVEVSAVRHCGVGDDKSMTVVVGNGLQVFDDRSEGLVPRWAFDG